MKANERKTFVVAPKTTSEDELDAIARPPRRVEIWITHPFKAPERYVVYGDVTMRLAEEMRKPEVVEYFTRLIMRVAPKSHAQAKAEVVVTRKF